MTLSKIWEKASFQYAFYAAKRIEKSYDAYHKNGEITGLSRFRSLLADNLHLDGVIKTGEGWNNGEKRQALVDWHLDKLATLTGNAYIVSALENTHINNYITEKIFDAFAVQAIPLYLANEHHKISQIIDKDSFINLDGLTIDQSLKKIEVFEPSNDFLEKYQYTQMKLAKLFSNEQYYINERKRLVQETINVFLEI